MEGLLETSLYFLALINPVSKIFLLSSVEPRYTARKLFRVSLAANGVALSILVVLAVVGSYLLHQVFRVELYSLQVAGGMVLFLIGLTAVTKGRFYEKGLTGDESIAIVPLGAPLIAGPGTITAAISFSAHYGIQQTLIALGIAVGINFGLMLMSMGISRVLEKISAIGPLIRISGLIVVAVAVHMALNGVGEWLMALGLVARPG
jgi:multiple antibiotic resistance protein